MVKLTHQRSLVTTLKPAEVIWCVKAKKSVGLVTCGNSVRLEIMGTALPSLYLASVTGKLVLSSIHQVTEKMVY